MDAVEDNIGGLNQLYIIYIATIYPTSTLWCIIGVGVSSSQQGGVKVDTGGYWRSGSRVLASQHPGVGVATIGCCCPDGRVLARPYPGVGHINTRVLATSTPGCCDAKRGVL